MAQLPYIIPYDPEFLGDGFEVPLPDYNCQGKLYRNGQVFDYIHYSLVLNQDRKSALYTAHNIDVAKKKSVSRSTWDIDPRIKDIFQTGPEAYFNNPWDRGHLVRRAAVAWGDNQMAKDASDSTFYYSGAVMQHSSFNQSDSKWLGLENWVLEKAGNINDKLCVFTGPIYTKIDQMHRGFRVPSAFFKIVVLRDPTANKDDLSALGFVMSQNEGWRSWKTRRIENLQPYLVGIKDIEDYAGLDFGELSQLDEFDWRQPKFRDRTLMNPIKIDGPDDIVFAGEVRRKKTGFQATKKVESLSSLGMQTSGQSNKVKKRKCKGCSEKPEDKRLVSIKKQLDSVTEILETFLEKNMGNLENSELAKLMTRYARVVGGQIVTFGNYPECVAIGDDTKWFCSGVLIKKNVVLTAAHCAPDITRVFLGGRQVSDLGQGEVIGVRSVHVHHDYRQAVIPSNDIALLILENDSIYSPVPIAVSEEIDKEDNMLLVGFGSDDPNGETGFGTKRVADSVRTTTFDLPQHEVHRLQTTFGFHHDFEFHTGKYGTGIDTCYGDSGGPAYIVVGDLRSVAGLTARAAFGVGVDCGDGGIYTRIDPYLGWIENVLNGGNEEVEEHEGIQLYIHSALPNPSGPDLNKEWIVLKNRMSEELNLTGYSVLDKQGGEIDLQGILQSNGELKIILDNGSAIKLANTGDEIILKKMGKEMHHVSYEKAGSGQIVFFDAPASGEDDSEVSNADPC